MNKDIFDYKINNLMKHLEINKDNLTKNFDFIKYELQAMIEDLMYQSFEDYRKSLKEIDRLNNIINELEKWLKKEHENGYEVYYLMAIQDILDKLKELKENNNGKNRL